jgi:XTP/dITP diphosphohydrolase
MEALLLQSIVIASGNPGKIREIKAILAGQHLEILSAAEFGFTLDVDETGTTYAENARLKAVAYQTAISRAVIADDSGLEVDALGGAPGIHSARYSPKPNASDADRRVYLLEQLRDKPLPLTAHFHCTAVLALPDGRIFETVGRCEGEIIFEERGTGGFGYDPIFYMPDQQATMSEIPETLKNQVSHRAKALLAMMPILESL